MTPIQLFLIQIALIILLYLIDINSNFSDRTYKRLRTLGGVITGSVIGTIVWGLIYYL